jgi:hypothetical protein
LNKYKQKKFKKYLGLGNLSVLEKEEMENDEVKIISNF